MGASLHKFPDRAPEPEVKRRMALEAMKVFQTLPKTRGRKMGIWSELTAKEKAGFMLAAVVTAVFVTFLCVLTYGLAQHFNLL